MTGDVNGVCFCSIPFDGLKSSEEPWGSEDERDGLGDVGEGTLAKANKGRKKKG